MLGKEIGVIGPERFSMGFRIVGVEETFNYVGKEGAEKLREMVRSGKYSLIICHSDIRDQLSENEKIEVDRMETPLVLFISSKEKEEDIYSMAKRILGVDIKNLDYGKNI